MRYCACVQVDRIPFECILVIVSKTAVTGSTYDWYTVYLASPRSSAICKATIVEHFLLRSRLFQYPVTPESTGSRALDTGCACEGGAGDGCSRQGGIPRTPGHVCAWLLRALQVRWGQGQVLPGAVCDSGPAYQRPYRGRRNRGHVGGVQERVLHAQEYLRHQVSQPGFPADEGIPHRHCAPD